MKLEQIIFNDQISLMEKGLFTIINMRKKQLLTLSDLSLATNESEDVIKSTLAKLINIGVVRAEGNCFKLNNSKKRKPLKNLVTRNELEDMYNIERLSVNEIAKRLNHNTESVRRLMNDWGIKRRTDAKGSIAFFERKNKNVEEEFFMIRTPDLHQIIGYYLTDGYIAKARTIPKEDGSIKAIGNPKIGIELTDKEVIDWIAKKIGYKNKIYIRKRGENLKPTYTIQFANKAVLEVLVGYGMTERKSNTLIMKDLLDRHLIRGIFEGDGSITKTKDGRYIVSFVSGSFNFIREIKDYIEKAVGGTTKIYKRESKSGNTIYSFLICTQEKVKKFGEYIYGGNYFGMKRKKDIFLELGANIEEENK